MKSVSLFDCEIRGEFPTKININYARAIGQKFIQYTGAKSVVVGYDNRFSSPILEKALIELMSCKVIRLELCSSPMLYFAIKKLELDGGIMITASHNPITDNGFKLLKGQLALFGQEIREMMLSQSTIATQKREISACTNIKQLYVQDLFISYDYNQKLKILWDPGQCTVGDTIDDVIKCMPEHEHILINGSISQYVVANPTPHNLQKNVECIKQEGCDVCFAFDVDGDRIFIVSNEGLILSSDQIIMIFLNSFNTLVGETVVVDVKISDKVLALVKNKGGTCIICQTGHVFIKRKMKEVGAILGGEGSGHIFFGEKGYDDALYAAIKFITLLSKSSWKKVLETIPVLYTSLEKRLDVEDKHKIMQKLQHYLIDRDIDFDDTDGIKVRTNDGWWLIRASNTEDKIVICCDANSEKQLINIQSDLFVIMKKMSIDV